MTFRDYLVLIKPKQTLLLLITMYGAYFAAGGQSPYVLGLISAAGLLTIAGTTAVNMVIERDIDALMPRTSLRPLARGNLSPISAATFSILIYTLGALVASLVGPLFTLTVLLGYFFDIIVYTNLAKRHTPLNIVLGGIAGGMPALGGWIAATGQLSAGGVILSVIVMTWIPMHIWFIATYFLDDYSAAGIPMAPVVLGAVKAAYLTEASTILMIILSWLFLLVEGYGLVTSLIATGLGVIAIRNIRKFQREPTKEKAYGMFKFASPLLATIFVILALEAQLGII